MKYNIYCDETCHLMNDGKRYMVLGCIWVPEANAKSIHKELQKIRKHNGLPLNDEFKWKKVATRNRNAYEEIVDLFFKEPSLHFRAVIIDKAELDHKRYAQTHDDWYYKMLFRLLSNIIDDKDTYAIYLDYKDTQSRTKARKLHEILSNSRYDFNHKIIENIQCVESSHVSLIQLVDILIGALEYNIHQYMTSQNKLFLINKIKSLSGKKLDRSTLPTERKFNIFFWHGGDR